MITELSSTTGDLVRAVLDVSLLRHKIIANNIANQNTLTYVPQKVDFESILLSELSQSNAITDDDKILNLLETTDPKITDRKNEYVSDKVENSIDIEMAELAKNTLKYEALIRGLSKLSDLRGMAISGGKK